MRPLRIELEGIGSFRERTVVDLTDVDLFVLVGPTGAGKTTIIDSIILACYGSVPRYDDRRVVAPIIHQGAAEGRVRLTFAVGPRRFSATRVVRRTRTGATTKEARLEEVTDGGSVLLAGSADEVTEAVTTLVGLNFDQFTRSVVLPQGAFDRFLFARPAERGDLLLQLLDLRLHEEVGRRARTLAQTETARADHARRRLEGELAGATPQARDQAQARVGELAALADRCRDAQAELDTLREEGAALAERAKSAEVDLRALDDLRAPDGLDRLRAELAAAAEARAQADAAVETAEQAVQAAEAEAQALPPAAKLTDLRRLTDEAAALDARAQGLRTDLEASRTAAAAAATQQREAETAVTAARDHLEAARRGELVHTLTEDLGPGDPCPVCGHELAELDRPDTPALDDARAALTEAERLAASAAEGRRRADADVAEARARAEAHEARGAEVAADRDALRASTGLPDDAALADAERRRTAADRQLEAARAEERRARTAARDARTAAQRLTDREREAWSTFDATRDGIAGLGPPPARRDDLALAWDELLAWAAAARPQAEERARQATAAVDQVRARYRDALGRLRQACQHAGVEVDAGASPGVAVATALATAQARHDALVERVATVTDVTAERDAAMRTAQVADQLGKLLRADGFERWLLGRALTRLVTGASALLRELSSGAYSLALDPTNQFLVLDHRNADEPRSVRSLSGGERFLASLALALALADHVAELAADGTARLESLFLDEGFGTLDPDTLDVVASALEELGARGRVVGLVTHVRDLADRLPVRFEVRRGPNGSSVSRVDADHAGEVPTADTDVPDEEVA